MTREEYIKIFNKSSLNIDTLKTLLTEFLTEIECEKISETVERVISDVFLIQRTYEEIKEHFCRKCEINRLISDNKIILYY